MKMFAVAGYHAVVCDALFTDVSIQVNKGLRMITTLTVSHATLVRVEPQR